MSDDLTQQLRALSRQGERTERALTALGAAVEQADARAAEAAHRATRAEELTGQLAETVTQLAHTLTTKKPANPGPGVCSWLRVDDDALDALPDLVDWVGRVWLRYDGAPLPPCWLWHPDAVEELLWLSHAWEAAYDPERGSWAAVADWHERLRPGVARRLAPLATCDLELHQPGARADRPLRRAPLADSAPRIADAWHATHQPPHPTPAEISEADQQTRSHTTRI